MQKKKILVIEDNTDIRENIVELLELDGHTVFDAPDGKVGVKKALSELPDLIICDIMMPELDGYGVLHILTRKPELANTPFIFLSAKAERSDVRKGMTLGADDYITKPFEDTELLDAVTARLSKREALKEEYAASVDGIDDFIHDVNQLKVLDELVDAYDGREYKKRQEVYREGETTQYLYYVQEGKVKSTRINTDGKELLSAVYVPGEFFGYESLLREETYAEAAETLEDSKLIRIPRQAFLDLLYSQREVARKFIGMLSGKVLEKEEQIMKLAYNSVRQRTAGALIRLYDKFDQQGAGTKELNVSREELANMVGTATESVIRAISGLKDDDVLTTKAGKITITDLEKLRLIEERHFVG